MMQPCGGAAEPPDLSLDSDEVSGIASYPLSLPSQPPDIRNWFSSYEYHSPECVDDPYGVHDSPLSQEDGEATQDPLESPPPFQNYLVEQQEKGSSPQGCNLAHGFNLRADSFLLKEKKTSLIQTECKKSVGDNGDNKCELLGSHQCSIENPASWPGKLLKETNPKESISGEHKSAVNLQYADKEDGFVTVKNNDNTGSYDQTWSRRPILKENLMDFAAEKCDENNKIQLPLDANFNWSNQDSNPGKKEVSSLKPKRKLNLQKLLGVEPPAKQCGDSPIQSKDHCNLHVSPEEPNAAQRTCAKNFVNFDCAFLDAESKSKKPDEITCQEQLLLPVSNDRGPKGHEMEIDLFLAMSKENSERGDGPHIEVLMSTKEHSKAAADTPMIGGAKREHLMDYCNGTFAAAKEQAQRRKTDPLADRTNKQADSAAVASGKWQCPRKAKPDTGPPLKQLRLGRWLRPI